MLTSDKNTNPFLESGDYDYVEKFQKIDTSLNKLIDELVDAQGPSDNIKDQIDALITDALQNRIIAGAGIIASYSTETGILTISLD